MNVWISKCEATIMCAEVGRKRRYVFFLSLFKLELVDRQWGRARIVLAVMN